MFLLTMVRKLVEGVVNEINKQKSNVVHQATDPLNSYINSIVGGVWVGPNADEFVRQAKQIIAELSDVTGIFGGMFNGLGSAIAAIDGGDSKAAGAVDQLSGIFSQIF